MPLVTALMSAGWLAKSSRLGPPGEFELVKGNATAATTYPAAAHRSRSFGYGARSGAVPNPGANTMSG